MKHLQTTKGRLAFTDIFITRVADGTIRIETAQDQLIQYNPSLAAWVSPKRAREIARKLIDLSDEIEGNHANEKP